jgi:hypothetical protein
LRLNKVAVQNVEIFVFWLSRDTSLNTREMGLVSGRDFARS